MKILNNLRMYLFEIIFVSLIIIFLSASVIIGLVDVNKLVDGTLVASVLSILIFRVNYFRDKNKSLYFEALDKLIDISRENVSKQENINSSQCYQWNNDEHI